MVEKPGTGGRLGHGDDDSGQVCRLIDLGFKGPRVGGWPRDGAGGLCVGEVDCQRAGSG